MQLTKLTTLDLRGCRALTGLPESLGQLAALTMLDVAFSGVTRLPESLGRLTALSELHIGFCQLTRLPFFIAHTPDSFLLEPGSCSPLTIPPRDVVRAGMPAIKMFLLARHHTLKMLLLILAARRRRVRHPPAELWVLICDDYFE